MITDVLVRLLLQKLRMDTDKAIAAVHARRSEINGDVNWSNLHCKEAAFVLTDGGYGYLRVIVKEAAPDAAGFIAAVKAELLELRWQDVLVETEW